jgi:hypothetical protein
MNMDNTKMSNQSIIKNSTSYPKILYDELEKLNKENNNNIKMNLFDYQKYIYDYMTKMDNRGILLYHSVGSGKCMKIDTPILMYDGNIKKIQHIKVGDLIMGDDNTPRTILSLARGVDNMYDILHNNEQYTVNEAHILCLKIPLYPLIRSNKKYKSVHWIENNKFCIKKFYNKDSTIDNINIFLKNIINEQILEISVYDYLKLSNRKKKILYSYKTIIDFPEKRLNIDPYTLGIWIGDINTDVFNHNVNTYFIYELKKLNLPNNKHIPYIYKCNSRENRLQLLAGIIDVSGYYNKKNKYVIKLGKKYPILINDILYLCNSLGYISYKKNIKNINYIYIYGNKLTEIPTQEFTNVQIVNSKKDTTFGNKIKVVYKNIDNYFGFTIDGNCRYVLGNFIVTHNTITSISIAEHFRQLNKDIIILSSKSLQNNYKKEITSFSKKINPEINDDEIESVISQYKFVTSNAKNMIKSLETDETLTLYKSKKKSDNDIENILSDINTQNLEDKIIIIDEAHNLFNSISNGSKIANDFYDMIMNTKNVKLIFLSGTPIINNPFEIAICCNMLYGPIYSNNIKKNKKKIYSTILPEYYTDFKKYFINEEDTNLSIKNTSKFMNRIFGLISYYGDFYFENQGNIKDELKKTLKKENYPDRLPVIFEIVEMSKYQNIEYTKARNIEKKENSSFRGGKNIKELKNAGSIVREKNSGSTSYRIKSRQLSNIYIPEKTDIIKQNLRIYSPKLERIYKNINEKHNNTISLVYSTFLEYGIKAFAKVLEFNNYKLYNKDEEYNKEYKYYAIFSGDQSSEEKADILNRLNLEENKYGDLISILLISKSGTEGLDLKNVRSIHIMEPYWNFSLIQQIIARGVRYKSHINLPEEERNVQTYIYLSDYNKEMLENEKSKIKERQNVKANAKKNKKEDKIELTTDINIFKNAIKNQELIYIFLKTIASTSIECPFFNKNKLNYDCFNCISDNKDLYYEDIDKDMELSNNCKRITTVKADEIIINGETYYYRKLKDTIEVFKYNDLLKGYTKINDPYLIDKIQNL